MQKFPANLGRFTETTMEGLSRLGKLAEAWRCTCNLDALVDSPPTIFDSIDNKPAVLAC